jgi:hypothetical protein
MLHGVEHSIRYLCKTWSACHREIFAGNAKQALRRLLADEAPAGRGM